MYLLIQPDEDGEPNTFMTDNEVAELLSSPEDYGVEKFLNKIPDEDPMYWSEGKGLLLKVSVVVPRSVSTRFVLD